MTGWPDGVFLSPELQLLGNFAFDAQYSHRFWAQSSSIYGGHLPAVIPSL